MVSAVAASKVTDSDTDIHQVMTCQFADGTDSRVHTGTISLSGLKEVTFSLNILPYMKLLSSLWTASNKRLCSSKTINMARIETPSRLPFSAGVLPLVAKSCGSSSISND